MPTAWSSPHPLIILTQCSLLYSFVLMKKTQCWSITLLLHHLQSSEMVFQSMRLKESWIVRFSMEGWSILCAGKGMVLLMTNGYLQGMFLEKGDLLRSFTNRIQRLINTFQLLYMPLSPSSLFRTSPNHPQGAYLTGRREEILTHDPRLQNKGCQA